VAQPRHYQPERRVRRVRRALLVPKARQALMHRALR
jgi:hypothetical protein